MNNGHTSTRPVRVTFCAYDGPGQINGPNTWLARVLPLLPSRGIEPRVLFLLGGRPAQCPTLRSLQAAGIACSAAPRQRSTGERVRWLLRELRAAPPDVFVPNVVLPAYYAARWTHTAGIATVGVLHSDDAFHHALVERFVAGTPQHRLSALVCVSQALEQLARGSLPEGAHTRIERIPYGVPVPAVRATFSPERFRLIYVGRLDEQQKRVSHVARAFCQAARAVAGVEGVLYGSGHARPAIEAILATEGAGLPVRLGGELPPEMVAAAMSQAHALVLLSAYEGLPIALMEAMACGLVPICTPMRSGIGELVRDGENGLIVQDDGAAFVAAVQHLRQEPQVWSRLSAAAHAAVATSYSLDICADRWAALLLQLSHGQSHAMIEVPRVLALPRSHRAFRREDHRGPPLLAEAIRHGRFLLGELRRRVRRRH